MKSNKFSAEWDIMTKQGSFSFPNSYLPNCPRILVVTA